MAVGIVFDGVGVSRAQYEQVLKQVSADQAAAPGMLSHVAGTTADGIVVVELWESQEALMAFFTQKLEAALLAAGITIRPKPFEFFNEIKGK
jgi:heme-degrading monooxygenase HmoA